MKLQFKTLQGKQFSLDVDPTETILSVKQKVGTEQKYDDPAGCRLIFLGKVLDDKSTLTECGLTETGVLVVMPPKKVIAKPKQPEPAPVAAKKDSPQPEPAESSALSGGGGGAGADAQAGGATAVAVPSSAPTITSSAPARTIPTPATPQPAPPPTSAPPLAPAPVPAPRGDTGLVMGEQFEASVQNIMAMGFEEAQVRRALRAAFNNPDRAVEYLCTSIPDIPDIQQQALPTGSRQAASQARPPAAGTHPVAAAAAAAPAPVPAPASAPTSAPTTTSSPAPVSDNPGAQPFNMFAQPRPAAATGGGDGGNGLDFLRSVPQFSLMRRMIQANPQLLQPILQQLGQANPALLTLINANQADFVRLMNEPLSPEEEAALEQMPEFQDGGEFAGGGALPPGHSVIQVTEEEREQISRLEALVGPMGLSRAAVLEAWLACDRNEEMAANYLLNNLEDFLNPGDDDDGTGGDMTE
eukprot:CAMPEP_0184699100 /NCGR_PEP_ID=MMETSP0313-20130426/5487_1 /TAXON_ID=2792 /ORGANISM="Porphyridium aerugineum, Strain SAG 1380-2" /LENGTH=469 /DNA_ID=CAMNT_0027158135 /DNA_START=181 /DNA_END=1590 /DNA_ORIENTATION=-